LCHRFYPQFNFIQIFTQIAEGVFYGRFSGVVICVPAVFPTDQLFFYRPPRLIFDYFLPIFFFTNKTACAINHAIITVPAKMAQTSHIPQKNINSIISKTAK
jgi:hypothetical protein